MSVQLVDTINQEAVPLEVVRGPFNVVITAFDSTGVADGAMFNFPGRDTVGDGGGGLLRFAAGSTATADGVNVFAPTGGGRLIREDLLSATPRQAGATGGADDTAAITRLMQANVSVEMPAETYTATPITGSVPAITRDYAQIVGGNLKVKTGTYATGGAGSITTYGFASLNGNGAVAFGTSFDGNGQATLLPYQPTLPNAYFYPFLLYGNKKGQKVIGTHSTGAGGHGIEGSQGSLMVMADNTAELHNGIGTTNTDGVVMSGMVSADTTDSHYYSNSNDSVAAVGLVGRNTTGGGGIDIAGGSDVVVGASSFANSKKHGAWVLKSPNTSALYDRVTLVGLHSYNNCLTPDNEQAEIVFGDQAHLADAQGNDGAVMASHLFPRDTPSTAGFNNAVWIHPKATRTSATGLVISPDDALLADNQPMIKDLGSIRPIVAHNSCHSGTGSTSGKVYYDATPVGYSHYAYNVGMRLHPLSKVPSAMEASDAVWPYHIVRNLTKAGIRLFRVDYLGGLCHDVIEVTLSQTNDNGAACYRVVLRGASGDATTNLGATLVWSAGTNPPQLTVSTGTGTATISANTASAGFDNELCAFDIRIISPQDEVVRFTPIFTA